VLALVLIPGITIPPAPVESAVNVLPAVEKTAEPPVAEGGGITPSVPFPLLV
jgi:hypothetical protein